MMNEFWKNKKVLVTGAAGFIGSHAVGILVRRGAIVTAAVSSRTTDLQLQRMLGKLLSAIKVKKVNLLEFEDCLEITKGKEIVLNFAALDGGRRFKQKYPAKIFITNTTITGNMLEAATKEKVQNFMIMSSIEVYPLDVQSPIKEEYGLKGLPNEVTEGYAWSKRFSEIAAKMYYKEFGLPVTIVRAGNVYGPRDYLDSEKGRVIPTFVGKVLKGDELSIIGDGSQKKSFLYVTDFIDAVLQLIEKEKTACPINIASEQYISITDLAKKIGKISDKKVNITYMQLKNSASAEKVISVEALKKLTLFKEKVSLEEGLSNVIAWVRKSYEHKEKI